LWNVQSVLCVVYTFPLLSQCVYLLVFVKDISNVTGLLSPVLSVHYSTTYSIPSLENWFHSSGEKKSIGRKLQKQLVGGLKGCCFFPECVGSVLGVRTDKSEISFQQLTVFLLFQMIVKLARGYLIGFLGYVRWMLLKQFCA